MLNMISSEVEQSMVNVDSAIHVTCLQNIDMEEHTHLCALRYLFKPARLVQVAHESIVKEELT